MFAKRNEASEAIRKYNGVELDGKPMKITIAAVPEFNNNNNNNDDRTNNRRFRDNVVVRSSNGRRVMYVLFLFFFFIKFNGTLKNYIWKKKCN